MIKKLFLLSILLLFGCGNPERHVAEEQVPQRIISLAPNITETLHDLELDNRLVGISRFSSAETDITIVGDFMNINYETVVSLQPDLVILEQSADAQKARLDSLGIPYLETASLTLAEVIDSMQKIGKACHAQETSDQRIRTFQEQLQYARNTPEHRPRTLLCFGDFSGASQVEQVYAFGSDCIHSELLTIAGGDNVVTDTRPSVVLSREAIIRLNPELIIELTSGGPANHWQNLTSVSAVQHQRIHTIAGTYTTIPSPNHLIKTLNDISQIVRQNDL